MIDYVVLENDTLGKIANYFQVSEDEIKKANNLANDQIEEGMVLKIPYDLKVNYYTVSSGDDLYSIARKYQISVEALAQLNGLKVGDYIYPGQKLLVPIEGYKIYITKDGDTVNQIHNITATSIENIILGNPNLYLLPNQLIVYSDKKEM